MATISWAWPVACQIRALKAQLNKGDKPWRDEAVQGLGVPLKGSIRVPLKGSIVGVL